MIKNSTRYNRLADSSPVPDVEGCNEISFSLKTTGNASKPGSFWPVFPAYGMAIGTFPAAVAWIHRDDGNAHFFCLVFDELSKLVESPRIVDVPVAFPNGCPRPYAAEVFNGNRRRGAFGFLNDLLRYHMVGVPGEPALLPGELVQMSPCRFPTLVVVSNRLQPGTEIGIVFPDLVDLITGIVLPGGIHRNIDDAHVNSHDVLRFDDGFFRNFNGNHEVEHFVLPDEITLTPDPFKGYLTIFSNGHGY